MSNKKNSACVHVKKNSGKETNHLHFKFNRRLIVLINKLLLTSEKQKVFFLSCNVNKARVFHESRIQ
uniref:Uncharacterized protein n=1 Tax=Lepeophtheirus salmonis TaxID=72036 RepID=A0A0K2U883_LEPSM